MARWVQDQAEDRRWDAAIEAVRRLVVALFVVVNVLNFVAILDGRFDHEGIRWVLLDSEGNLSTWFASALWLVAAFAALGISLLDIAQRSFWILLAWTLAALSLEEVAQLHELVSGNLSAALDEGGPVTAAWVVPGAILVVGWTVLMVRIAPRDQKKLLVPLAVGGSLFVLGSLGLEVLVGELFTGEETDRRPALWMATLEENLEMVGAMVVANALVEHVRRLASLGASA